jgi:DNA-directed RNA polymerase beta' subunit
MRVNWKDVMNIISYTTIDSFRAIKKNKEYTGQEIFSLIIPDKINLKKKGLVVEKGKIKEGKVSKAHLGSGKDQSLVHLIWNEYGFEGAKTFLDNTQRLVNNFNLLNGFSVGIGDIIIPDEVTKQLKQMFETKKLEVDHMITSMENNPDMYDMEVFERNVNGKLNAIAGETQKIVMANLKPDNKFGIMINSGAKGSDSNMAQMSGCIGQTAVEGKRVRKKLHGRTLSCFAQDDDSAQARGFIDNSFYEGMTPTQFIFHNMGSREGLIDTAIKSVTGDTPVIIMEEGQCRRVMIGDWIDDETSQHEEKILHTHCRPRW